MSKEAFNFLLTQRSPIYKLKGTKGEYIGGIGMWIWSKSNAGYNVGLNTVFILFPDSMLVVAFVNSKGKGVKNINARTKLAYSKSFN